MTTSQKLLPPPGIVLPSSNLARRTEQFGITAQAQVNGAKVPTAAQRYIAEKMHERLQLQLTHGILTEHAQQLTQVLSLRTMERFDEFVQADTVIRTQERPVRDQADVEYFNAAVRQAQASTLLALRNAGAQQIEQVVVEPFQLPTEEVVVAQPRGFWSWLTGQPQSSKVR